MIRARALCLVALALASPVAAQEVVRRDATVLCVEKVGPAVANIATEEVVERSVGGARLEEWLGRTDRRQRRRVVATSLGTGVVVDPDGYVVTNAHVVARASRIVVTLPDTGSSGGHEHEANLLSVLLEDDLALLKIDADRPLPWVKLGAPGDVMVGETCLALGNPFGLENTVTRGVISARGRRLTHEGRELPGEFLQTDAAINPGNSGGPLVNLAGELLGINTAVASGGQGIGFAIPSSRVRAALASLSSPLALKGRWLGLDLEDAPKDGGARVKTVDAAGPAAAAGLKPGDVIVAAGAAQVATAFQLHTKFLGPDEPGAIRLAVVGPDGARRGAALAPGPAPYARDVRQRLGVTARELTPALAWRLGLGEQGAVLVDEVEPGSPAEQVGVEKGDVLVRLGPRERRGPGRGPQAEAQTIKDLWGALKALPPGAEATVTIRRRGRDYQGELKVR